MKQKPTGMSSLEPSKKSQGLPSLEPYSFPSSPSLISSVVLPCNYYYVKKYDFYNDFTCDDIDCGYDLIISSCYVGDFNRDECSIGAVDVCPKCGE